MPFIEYTDSTPNMSFEVPEGFTAVVREIDFFTAVGDEAWSVGYQNPGADQVIRFAAGEAAGANVVSQWRGRAPINQSGALIILLAGGLSLYSTCYVGGYLLRNDYS